MKIFHLLLAAGLLTTTAASAQTTPGTTVPSNPGTPAGTASPSATPSGMAAPTADPKAAVSSSEVFTKGAPMDNANKDKRMKRKKNKETMPEGGKMKTKM